MKTRLTALLMLLLLTLYSVVLSADKTDFSGQWVMDKSKSEGLPADMDQRMKVTQNGDRVEIETDIFQGDNVNTIPDSYSLDGKEVEFPVRLNSGEETKAKRVAKWNADGKGFVVNDVAVFEMPDGKVTVTTVRKWALAADGKSLVIELTRTAPQGTTAAKRTFNRK